MLIISPKKLSVAEADTLKWPDKFLEPWELKARSWTINTIIGMATINHWINLDHRIEENGGHFMPPNKASAFVASILGGRDLLSTSNRQYYYYPGSYYVMGPVELVSSAASDRLVIKRRGAKGAIESVGSDQLTHAADHMLVKVREWRYRMEACMEVLMEVVIAHIRTVSDQSYP